jgi:Amt family ammonium transporter
MNRYKCLVLVGGAMLPGWVCAEDASMNAANTAWILTATALVLFMTLPGLALFYGGLVRSKNVLSILMQCFSITAVVSLLWMVAGYSLAFTHGGSVNDWIGGLDAVFLANLQEGTLWPTGNIPESVFAMYQMTFAIITPALVIGAFAERVRFGAMLLFSSLWLMLVYVPVCHWVWGGGWLASMGAMDFAGGIVVHITAGIAALVCALVIGPRRGFQQQAMMPHNLTMTVTGAGMLWVGWFGFNAGSALGANGDAGMAMLATHMSAAAGAATWGAIEWIRHGKPSVLGIVTGMVAGLGTITPASGFVGPLGALVIGVVAGLVCFYMTMMVKKIWKIDDSLDVFPVHGVGGVIGTLMTAVFASAGIGAFSGQGFLSASISSIGQQLMVQATAVVAVIVFTAAVTWLLLKLVNFITPLRVSQEEETEGLDITAHDERGYVL